MPITGPLGIWQFPILNALLEFLSHSKGQTMYQAKETALLENIEEWEVVRDEEGLPKSIIVKRTVKRVG